MGNFAVEKQIGPWTNAGLCEATGDDKSCGPGNQRQTRSCTDGTTENCSSSEREQTVSCSDAGTSLDDCPGKEQ